MLVFSPALALCFGLDFYAFYVSHQSFNKVSLLAARPVSAQLFVLLWVGSRGGWIQGPGRAFPASRVLGFQDPTSPWLVWAAAAGGTLADLAQAAARREDVAPSLGAAERGGAAGLGTHSRSTGKEISSGMHRQSTGHPRKPWETSGPEGNPGSSLSFQHCQFPSISPDP